MKDDTKLVKEIGEKIGYGHLMYIASALWRKKLKNDDYSISGAFIPTIIFDVKNDLQEQFKTDMLEYDEYIK